MSPSESNSPAHGNSGELSPARLNVVIVEDVQLMGELLQMHCEGLGFHVLDLCLSYEAGLRAICRYSPDLVLMDISLPDGDGLEMAEHLLARNIRSKFLAVSSHCDPWTISRVRRCGVHGYLNKNMEHCEILAVAIRTILEGRAYFPSLPKHSATASVAALKVFNRVLSDHETKVLALIGECWSDDEIGLNLNLSASTVQSLRRDIMRKLNIHSTPKLIYFAIANGLTRAENFTRHKTHQLWKPRK